MSALLNCQADESHHSNVMVERTLSLRRSANMLVASTLVTIATVSRTGSGTQCFVFFD